MTVQRWAGGIIRCLAADTKPSAANFDAGTILQETDTLILYISDGTNWKETPPRSEYNFLIYKAGSNYKAMNGSTRVVDYSGTVLHTVHNNALTACPTNEGHVIAYMPGTYTLTGQCNIKNYTSLLAVGRHRLHEDTPAGTMFIKDASFTSGTMIGALDPASNLRMPWIRGLSFYGVNQQVDAIDAGPIWMGRIEDCQMWKCNRGVFMQGILNANDDTKVYGCRIHECDRGIQIGTLISACDIFSNVIGKCDKDGILANGFSHRIHHNKIYENSKEAAGFTGIALTNANYSQVHNNQVEPDGQSMSCISLNASDYCEIVNNRFKTGSGQTGRHGIILSNGSDYNKIINNLLGYNGESGAISIDVRDTSANNELHYNSIANFTFPGGRYSSTCFIQGNKIIDEKNPGFGANTIGDGGTISHGLPTTPSVVTVTTSVANEIAAVTARTSTTFTVAIKKRVDGTAGTSQVIYWRASI